MIPELIYLLCVLTCAGCAFLLWRAFRRNRSSLLFWSALCFAILALANMLLFADLVLYPDQKLLLVRTALNLLAAMVLLYGIIFKSR